MSPDWLVVLRDASIVVLTLSSFVVVLVLGLIAWKVYQLVSLIKAKSEEFSMVGRAIVESVRQTAEKANDTATTVKGSAEFVSDTLVSPVVQVVSAVSGARGFVAALFRLPGSPGRGGRR